VETFELIDHPKATYAYAWSEATPRGHRRYFVFLHAPPVDSPVQAVRARILADARRPRGN
jgi:hypothetical protein